MQPEEDVPVVIHVEQVVRIVAGAKPLSCGRAEKHFGLGGAPARSSRQPVVLLGRPLVEVHVFVVAVIVVFLRVRQHPPLGEEHVGDEVVDDLLDLVFVVLVDAALSFHVVDDQSGGVLQDLAIVVSQRQVRAGGGRGVVLRSLFLSLNKHTDIERYKYDK